MNDKPSINPDSQVCMITGGTSGIGLATAQLLASQGFNISICGRNNDRLVSAKDKIIFAGSNAGKNIECLAVESDLNDVGQARRFAAETMEAWGRVDVLVNNASVAPLAPFEDIGSEIFESTVNVGIRSLFYLTQTVWKQMKSRGQGVVINISSLSAVDPFPGFSIYGACKAWLDLVTHSLAREGEEHGLRVYSIRPGAVETPMLRGLFPDFPPDQCVQPEDIAQVVWECISNPEEYESGMALEVTNQPVDQETT